MRQYNLGRWLGLYKVQLIRSQTYYGFVTGLFAAVAARAQLSVWFPWLSFPLILLLMFVGLHLLMILDHVLIKRSEYAHQAEQSYIPENPVVVDIQALRADMDKVKQVLRIET